MIYLVIILILLAVLIGSGLFIFKYIRIITDNLLNIPYPLDHPENNAIISQDVEFSSMDGTVLQGKFVLAPNGSRKTVIFCHEFGSDQNSWIKYLSFLPSNGFNVFTFDFRKGKDMGVFHRNGFSPKQWPTRRELRDLLSAIEYLQKRSDVDGYHLGVFGVSKGAGLAISAAARSRKIKAVVTDGACPVSETIKDYMRKWASIYIDSDFILSHMNETTFDFLSYWSIRFASYKLQSRILFIEKDIRRARQPIFLIHGEADHYIRPDHARYLYERARSEKELWIVPDASHNDSVLAAPKQYGEKVLTFFRKHLGV